MGETAWIYVGEKVQQTAFGMELSKQRTVLVIYFDKGGKVTDLERLGVADGKSFQIDSRRTPSFGQDRSFIESIIIADYSGQFMSHIILLKSLTLQSDFALPYFNPCIVSFILFR